jgi:hypothetical protein
MTTEYLTVSCPNCSTVCEATYRDPGDQHYYPWIINRAFPLTLRCRCCDWVFTVNADEQIEDDGGVDTEPPFEVDAEGELTADPLLTQRCPHCQRMLETEAYGPAVCPWCHHHVNLLPPPGPRDEEEISDYDPENIDDDYVEMDKLMESCCPACEDMGDLDGPEFYVLRRGWVQCKACGWSFFRPRLWQDLREPLYDELAWRGTTEVSAAPDPAAALAKALYQTEGRAHLRLPPGTYTLPREPGYYLPDGEVTIQVAGPAEEVRLCGRLGCAARRVRLRGVTLADGAEFHDCQVLLEGCRIEGTLHVHGPHGRLRLQDCRIANSAGPGLSADDGAVVRLTGCELSHNQEEGIRLRRGSWLRLVRSRLVGNGGAGIRVIGGGSVFLHNCLLAENGGSGLDLCRGRAVVRRTEFIQQRGPSLRLGRGGRLIVMGCRLRDGQGDGLQCGPKARALVTDSEVSAHVGTGLALADRARVWLRRSGIGRNGIGVALGDNAVLGLRDARIEENTGRDWDMQPHSRLILVKQHTGEST